MAYTNPSETSAYTQTTPLTGTTAEPVVIANTDTYGADVYARVLTVASTTTLTSATVISGGTTVLGATNNSVGGASAYDIIVGNGGYVSAMTNNYGAEQNLLLSRGTIMSGGTLTCGNRIVLSDCVIQSGGVWNMANVTILAGHNTVIDPGATVSARLGTDFFVDNGTVKGMNLTGQFTIRDIDVSGGTVGNGGQLYMYGSNIELRDINVVTGGKILWEVQSNTLAGEHTNISKGAIARFGANAEVVDGVASNFAISNNWAFTFGDGITLKDATITSGATEIASGAKMIGGTVSVANNSVTIASGAEIRNTTVTTTGRVFVYGSAYDVNAVGYMRLIFCNNSYAENIIGNRIAYKEAATTNVTIAGANTSIDAFWYESNGSLAYRYGTTAKIVNGEAQNFTLNIANHTLNLGTGITLKAAAVSNGTTNLLAGATMDAGTITAGTVNAKGALVSGTTITGGTLNATNNAVVSAVTVNGGTLNATTNAVVSGAAVGGGAVNVTGTVMRGGAITAGSVKIDAGGTAESVTVTGGSLTMGTNTTALNVTVTDGYFCLNTAAATIAGANTNISAIGTYMSGNAPAGWRFGADAKIVDGVGTGFVINNTYSIANRTWSFGDGITIDGATINYTGNVNLLAGAKLKDGSLAAGRVGVDAGATVDGTTVTGGTIVASTGALVSGAAINGGEVIASGGLVSGGTVAAEALVIRGGEAREVEIRSGGLIHVSNGGVANGIKFVQSGASMFLSTGAVANDVDITKFFPTSAGYDIFVNRVCLGVGNGATVNTLNNSARLNVSGGGTINGLMLYGGAENVCSTTTQNITIIGGQTDGKLASLIASSGTVLSNFQFGAAAWLIASANTVVSGGAFDGSTFNVRGATVRAMTMGAGTMNVSAGLVEEYTLNSGSINFSAGTAENLTINKGTVTMSGGNADTVHVNGEGATLAIRDGGTASNVIVSGDPTASASVSNARVIMYGGVLSGASIKDNAFFSFSAGTANDLVINDNGRLTLSTGVTVNRVTLSGGETGGSINNKGGVVNSVTQVGGVMNVTNLNDTVGTVNDVAVSGGIVNVSSGGTVNNAVVTGGSFRVSAGAAVTDVTVGEDGSAIVAGTLNVKTSAWNVTVNNGGIVNVDAGKSLGNVNAKTGARINVTKDGNGASLKGDKTNIAAGALYYSGAQLTTAKATDGILTGLNAGTVYKLSIGDGILVNDVTLNNGEIRISCFDGASVDGATVSAGAIICNGGATGTMDNVTLVGAGIMNLSGTAQANNTVVSSGGQFALNAATVKAENTTLKAGAKFNINAEGADTGEKLTLDVSGGTAININYLNRVADHTEIVLVGETAGNTYTIATTGSTDKYVNCGEWGLYDDRIKSGETITNAFTGMTYTFSDGKTIAVTEFAAATQSEAGSIESGTDINGNGKAAKWTANTTAAGTITAATSAIAGDAWLELDGANLAGTTLFGAEVGFGGGVNLYATNNATIGNLAAGATSSGTVSAVKLTVDSATVGLAYAGGFGNVTGKTETLIGTGATMQKDFYAGTLANYAKTTTATSQGDISLKIDAGEFSGNIYGAASVKAAAATSVVHSVGNVTIDVTGGETKKGNQACLFAGGYATGTTTNKVYTVGTVSTAISGGSWGSAAGGRGVFGGIFASNVTAEAGNVSITVKGGSMGNVFGGGWAQKYGTSIVGNVNISIAGGEVKNVFGGGSHSTSGGTTTAGAVTITVSGGSITGDIYARGQSDGDTTGAASVIFTGATDFGCGVYGYSYVGSEVGGAALSYTDYTGTFSGKVGGFVGITLDEDTAMTLGTAAADVSNGKWEFDFTDRADTLAGTSFLTWNSADFAGDTVRVNFADADQAAAGWSIATATFDATTTFTLAINDEDVATVAYDTAISGGAWDGWKFTSVDGTLKFAQLA